MLRCCSGLVVVIALSSGGVSISRADDPAAAKHYGTGVHEYYQGRYFEALRHFDQSIQQNGRDARAYFFRGLAKRRMGRTDEARVDFQTGSQIEVALKSRNVGMALQRVQGPDRLSIERYRRDARHLPVDMLQKVDPRPATSTVQRRAPHPPTTVMKPNSVVSDLADDESDPFRDSAPGLLGRGEIEAAKDPSTETPASLADDADAFDEGFGEGFDDDEPFGSGVVAEAESDDQAQDPFAMDDDPASVTATDSKSGSSGMGAFGAAIRAFSRTVAPTAIAEQGEKLLNSVRGSGAPGDETDDPFAGDAFTGDTVTGDTLDDDPFAVDDTVDSDSTDDATPEDDPFTTDSTDDGQNAVAVPPEDPPTDTAESDDAETQEATADDEQDPFADDPFNFE